MPVSTHSDARAALTRATFGRVVCVMCAGVVWTHAACAPEHTESGDAAAEEAAPSARDDVGLDVNSDVGVDADPEDAQAETNTAPSDATIDADGVEDTDPDSAIDAERDGATDAVDAVDAVDAEADANTDAPDAPEDSGAEPDLCAEVTCEGFEVPEPRCEGDNAARFKPMCVAGACQAQRIEQRCRPGTCVEGLCETPPPVFVDSGQRMSNREGDGCDFLGIKNHSYVHVEDFNLDGFVDVVFVGEDGDGINGCSFLNMYMGDGSGYFEFEDEFSYDGAAVDSVVGEFFEEELGLYAVLHVWGQHDNEIYIGCDGGDCTYNWHWDESCWGDEPRLISGDFDQDGLDEVLTFGGSNQCSVCDPDGDVIYSAHGVGVDYFRVRNVWVDAWDGLVGDLDQDGFLDVLTLGEVRVCVQVDEGGDRPIFHASDDVLGESRAGALIDLNGDGCVDAALVMDGVVQLFENDCAGNLSLFGSLQGSDVLDERAVGVDVADLDGDHDQDIIVSSVSVSVYLNDGAGVFEHHTTSGVDGHTGRSKHVGLRDLDQDGDVDMVVTGLTGPSTVWFNRTHDPLCEGVVCDPPVNTCDGDRRPRRMHTGGLSL